MQMSVESIICQPRNTPLIASRLEHVPSAPFCVQICLWNGEFVQLLLFDTTIGFYDKSLLQTAGSPGT